MTDQTLAPSFSVADVDIAALTPNAAVELIVRAASERRRLAVHLCNSYTLSLARKDARLRAALQAGDLNLPDGAPIAWLGRQHGVRRPVRGPDLVTRVCREGVDKGLSHYLYGGAPGVADSMAKRLRNLFPAIDIRRTECPPYRRLSRVELRELAGRIRESDASVVWLGLGTPRQDYLVDDLLPQVDCPVVPVGAAFDFISGRIREAPSWLHGTGLEWAYRLQAEPRRLWRRYLVDTPGFIVQELWSRQRA